MKRRKLTALLIAVILSVSVIAAPMTSAAGDMTFLLINDTLCPLSDYYMPIYADGAMYLPADVFTSFGLGITITDYTETQVRFSGYGEELEFDFEAGTAHGSDGAEYSPGALGSGTLYVPVMLMCSYFGLRQSYITASPADIIRITSGNSSIPDAFVPMAFRSQLTNAYREYSMQNTPVIVEPLPDEEDTPDEEEEDEKLSGITVSVSVIGTENADRALAALSAMRAKAVFFVSVSDILENPGVIRMLDGHDIPLGILLEEGTPEELEHALRLLYEASAVHTMLVTARGDVSRDAEKTCRDMGYIYLGPDVYFDAEPGYFTLKASIPSEEGSKAHMAFSGGALTESVFLNISEIGCAVGIIDELTGAD